MSIYPKTNSLGELEQRREIAPKQWPEDLATLSKLLEKSLYSLARSRQEYTHTGTLQKRLDYALRDLVFRGQRHLQGEAVDIGYESGVPGAGRCLPLHFLLANDEIIVYRVLRLLETRRQKAAYINDIAFHSADWTKCLPTVLPSIVWETDDPTDKSLLHYVCEDYALRSDHESILLWGARSWGHGWGAEVLLTLWRVHPKEDTSIFPHVLALLKRSAHYAEGELLDLLGMAVEHCPMLFVDLYPPQKARFFPRARCHWSRLAIPCEQNGKGGASLIDAYPNLFQHLLDLCIDLRGIDEEGRTEEESVDGSVHTQILTNDADDLSVGNANHAGRKHFVIGSQRIRQILVRLSMHCGIARITSVWGAVGDELDVECTRPEDVVQQGGCGISIRDVWLESILPFFMSNRLPIHNLHCSVSVNGMNAVRLADILRNVKLRELLMSSDDVAGDSFNYLIRTVAQHKTIRSFTLGDSFKRIYRGNLDSLAELVNLHSLKLYQAASAVVAPLLELLRNTQKLRRLDVSGLSGPDLVLLADAVGQSRSVREFGLCADVDQGDYLMSLVPHLETSNTNLEIFRQRLLCTDDTSVDSDTSVDLNHTSGYHCDLTHTIEYYCDLNWLGRSKLRDGNLTKSEFVEEMLERVWVEKYRRECWEPDKVRATRLTYGLLRENPALWCT